MSPIHEACSQPLADSTDVRTSALCRFSDADWLGGLTSSGTAKAVGFGDGTQGADAATQIPDAGTHVAGARTQIVDAGTQIAGAGTQIAGAGTQIADAATHVADAGAQIADSLTSPAQASDRMALFSVPPVKLAPDGTNQPDSGGSGEPIPGGRSGSGTDGPTKSAAPHPETSVVWPDLKVFSGSYYHKEVSAVDTWSGITTTVRLGQPVLDAQRVSKGKHHQITNLDDFSIYLGGTANTGKKQTVEAGFSWEVTLDKHGKRDEAHKVWRPFWRSPDWHNAPAKPAYYWHPGDVVNMTLSISSPNHMRLTIADQGAKPKHSYSVDFKAPGMMPGDLVSMRRVTAIDQSGREGNSVQPTSAKLIGTVWQNTELLRQFNGEPQHVPMTPALHRTIDTPPGHQRVQPIANDATTSGEIVDILGKSQTKAASKPANQSAHPKA